MSAGFITGILTLLAAGGIIAALFFTTDKGTALPPATPSPSPTPPLEEFLCSRFSDFEEADQPIVQDCGSPVITLPGVCDPNAAGATGPCNIFAYRNGATTPFGVAPSFVNTCNVLTTDCQAEFGSCTCGDQNLCTRTVTDENGNVAADQLLLCEFQ